MNEVSKYKDLLEQNVSMTLLSSRSMLESVNKRKEGTRAGDVKSKVMAEIYSCGIKPKVQSVYMNDCTLIMIKDLGYTSVDKSLRTCENLIHPHICRIVESIIKWLKIE